MISCFNILRVSDPFPLLATFFLNFLLGLFSFFIFIFRIRYSKNWNGRIKNFFSPDTFNIVFIRYKVMSKVTWYDKKLISHYFCNFQAELNLFKRIVKKLF